MNGRDRDGVRRSSATVTEFLVAVLFGVAIGLLVSFMVVLSLVLVVGAFALALIGLAQRHHRRSGLASGVLVGSGGSFLYGTINTVAACLDDRCGGGNPWPFAVFALIVFGVGLASGLVTLRRLALA